MVISLKCEKLVGYFTKQLCVGYFTNNRENLLVILLNNCVLVISLNNRDNLVGYFTKQLW